MPELTDHENIMMLTKAVENLGKRLDEKLLELKADIRELKDNYANRLGTAEQRLIDIDKIKVAKSEQDLINKEIRDEQDIINKEFRCDIDSLKGWRWYIIGATAIIVPVLSWLVVKFLEHITT